MTQIATRATFTPAPWIVEPNRSDPCITAASERTGDTLILAQIISQDGSAANARLMAAAPDLYAALKALVASGGDSTDAMYKASRLLDSLA